MLAARFGNWMFCSTAVCIEFVIIWNRLVFESPEPLIAVVGSFRITPAKSRVQEIFFFSLFSPKHETPQNCQMSSSRAAKELMPVSLGCHLSGYPSDPTHILYIDHLSLSRSLEGRNSILLNEFNSHVSINASSFRSLAPWPLGPLHSPVCAYLRQNYHPFCSHWSCWIMLRVLEKGLAQAGERSYFSTVPTDIPVQGGL